MSWHKAATLADLQKGPAVFKHSPKQIALFQVAAGVFAVDNRCPHEGYPLAEGSVSGDCVLTCNWHNWKFQLKDGQCILGGDNVRCYPVKVDNGDVWVNLTDPPPAELERTTLDGLKIAFEKRDFERICREISRLHYHRLDPMVAVRKSIEWSHDRFEFGFTHAYAAGADWLALAAAFDGDWERQLVGYAEAVDHMAFDALRRPADPFAPPSEPFDSDAFTKAVEAEDRLRAEGMIRGGLDAGLHAENMHEALALAALAHYNDFGHSLIYVYKAMQLIEIVGTEVEAFVLLPLARHLCYTTREDLIPEFKEYAPTLLQLGEASGGPSTRPSVPFPASNRQAFAWLIENWRFCQPPLLYDVMLEALARNMLHFDAAFGSAFDRSVSQNVGWLDFTHGITFANAVRATCTKFPRLWPQALLQMACFIGRNRSFLDLESDESSWFVDDCDRFLAESCEMVLDHGCRDPIFSAHLLKTMRAVQEELPSASETTRRYLLAGLNRFLHSPIKQKHVRRLARQAIALVKRDFG